MRKTWDWPTSTSQPMRDSPVGRALRWEYDRATRQGQLSCMPGCAGSARPVAPQVPRGTPTAPNQAAACLAGSRGSVLALAGTRGHVQEATNSWLYVPLLHAAWRADWRKRSQACNRGSTISCPSPIADLLERLERAGLPNSPRPCWLGSPAVV